MKKVEQYWDTEYPTHIIVPTDYWVTSCNVEYIEKEENESSNSR